MQFKQDSVSSLMFWGWFIWLYKPFVSNASFLYLLNTENRKVFWCFQDVEKGCIGNKWVKKYPILQWKFQGQKFCHVYENRLCYDLTNEVQKIFPHEKKSSWSFQNRSLEKADHKKQSFLTYFFKKLFQNFSENSQENTSRVHSFSTYGESFPKINIS